MCGGVVALQHKHTSRILSLSGVMGADIKHNEQVTDLDAVMEHYDNNPSPIYGYCMCDHCKEWRATGALPPETTTPMPAQLHWAYDKLLGWPGLADRVPPGDLSVRTATVKP